MTNFPMLGRTLLRPFAIVLLSLALGACGFHLRNALLLPSDLGPLRVVSPNPYSQLGESLSEELTRAGATPAPEPVSSAGANDTLAPLATLRVVSENWATTSDKSWSCPLSTSSIRLDSLPMYSTQVA